MGTNARPLPPPPPTKPSMLDASYLPQNTSDSILLSSSFSQQPPSSAQHDDDDKNANHNNNNDHNNHNKVLDTGPDDQHNNVPDQPPPPPVSISGRTADRPTLLAFMYIRFREKRHSYSYSATFYRRLDTFCFFLPLMALQCAVAVVYVAANKNEEFQRLFSGCVSAVSAVLIAIQMKLKWGEKAEQFQGGTRQYALLASETFFKWLTALSMTEEEFRDFVKDTGQLEKEIQDTVPVPPSWIASKFEQHRLQLTVTTDSSTQMSPVTMNLLDVSRNNTRKSRTTTARPGAPQPANNNNNRARQGEDVVDAIRNLPPPDDLNPPPSGLLQARSRLRMSRPGGQSFEMLPPAPMNANSASAHNNNSGGNYPVYFPHGPSVLNRGPPPPPPPPPPQQHQPYHNAPIQQHTRESPETAGDSERVPFIDGSGGSNPSSPAIADQPSTSSSQAGVRTSNINRPDIRLQRKINW